MRNFQLLEENRRLQAEIARFKVRPCPYVVTGDEGTSHCALAESNLRESDAARKVADAAVGYMDLDGDPAVDAAAWHAFAAAVGEYRKYKEGK